tara:strand:+ start:385 stop:672 length:288 start_codon:yes stop_codon:yes gene_type:complete
MISKDKVDFIINEAIKEVLINKDILIDKDKITMEYSFIGPNSNIESIDIVQIISFVEDRLEDNGLPGIDLFEKTLQNDSLTFNQFSELIISELKS